MAKDPGLGYKITATVTGLKGTCNAGHRVGETFDLCAHDPGGLCGFFFHDLFPSLQTFQFGGTMPWWQGDVIELQCPDSYNLLTLQLERKPR
jgi:uncharacterized repeat protein (TIGR04076 family)